jgi:hypothetical protein
MWRRPVYGWAGWRGIKPSTRIKEKPGIDNLDALQEETKEGHYQKSEAEQNAVSKEARQIFNKWKNVKVSG